MMTVHVERGSDVTFHYALAGKEETAKIHKSDYDHLRSLFDKANPSEKDDDSFHKCLLKLLLRCCSSCSLMRSYNTVSGNVRGYQMALPTAVFQYLKDKYRLEHECFASPMNSCAAIGSFCSRFKDTDTPFNSKGSFFAFNPEEGVFESNPPFVEECMIRNIKHILELLEKAEEEEKELTFFIIVPKWDEKDCESYNLTVYTTPDRSTEENNKFFVHRFVINRNDHFYRNGMGYQDNYKVMSAKNDSLLLVLQSSAAREKNPIDTDEFDRRVEEGWKKSCEEYQKEQQTSQWGRRSSNRDSYQFDSRKRDSRDDRQRYSHDSKRRH